MSKPPTIAALKKTAADWNAQHPIGTLITRYALIDPLREPTDTLTTSEAWVMGGHSVMVKVAGVAGGVLLESIVLRPEDTTSQPPIGNVPPPAPSPQPLEEKSGPPYIVDSSFINGPVEVPDMLCALRENRILKIIPQDDGRFMLREQCDECFDLIVTPHQLHALGQELIALAK